jgi:16S rRNA (adenine1518-N6/adenine1519-N6)-dimethyltransferase
MLGEAVRIVHGNVLDIDLAAFARNAGVPVHVVGNIPYHLTSEIFFWLLDQRAHVADATIMVQLEVAKRLASGPGSKEYGILSVFAQRFTTCRTLFKVSRNCFFPRPDVDSAIIQLVMRPPDAEVDEAMYRRVVRAAFGQRRKMLRNGLKGLGLNDASLDSLPFDLTQRPEQLSAAAFATLTREVERCTS